MISALCFIEGTERIIRISGVEVAKGWLCDIGINLGEKMCRREEFSSFSEFIKRVKEGQTNIAKINGPIQVKEGIFLLKVCPFAAAIKFYRNRIKKFAKEYKEIVDSYNRSGGAITPFCLVHQPFRKYAGKTILMDGKPLEILQLACKSVINKKVFYAEKNLNKLKISKKKIKRLLKDYYCAYYIKK